VILEVDNKPIQNLAALIELTDSMLGGDPDKKVPVLVKFERSGEQLLSVVEVGIDQLSDPDREVVRGWLPVETQVITRELADKLGLGRTQGVRVTRLYNQRPDDFPLQVGDFITHLEGEVLPASRREDADVFRTALRQYRPGREVPFGIIRDGERKTISVRIMPSPTQVREMKRLRDVDFEFIVREAAWQDMEKPTLAGEAFTVIVDDVVSGGWAGLGGLQVGDVLLRIDGVTVEKIEDVRRLLDQAREQRNRSVVLQVRRDIRNEFIELEPKWN
jgi:S1-C subfamily serine protease